MKLNKLIDHTLLKPSATKSDIVELCKQAREYDFFAVCVNSSYVKLAKKQLEGSAVKVCTVVGFPLGAISTSAKVCETDQALEDGADEIDMVIHIGMLKSCDFTYVLNDIKAVRKACGEKCLKVILEVSELTVEEIKKACELSLSAKADFVKTSTGFSSSGASPEAVSIMRATVGSGARIKASGGIRDYKTARHYIDLGVDRLGVSAGIAIIKGKEAAEGY